MNCLSQAMSEKLEYACEAFIKELVILKTQEDETGDKETYRWLNIVDQRGRLRNFHAHNILEKMFDRRTVLSSVITDYFVSDDVPMLKTFVDNYSIYTDEIYTEDWWRSITWADFFPDQYSNLVFEVGMNVYMKIHLSWVISNLRPSLHVIDTNTSSLK